MKMTISRHSDYVPCTHVVTTVTSRSCPFYVRRSTLVRYVIFLTSVLVMTTITLWRDRKARDVTHRPLPKPQHPSRLFEPTPSLHPAGTSDRSPGRSGLHFKTPDRLLKVSPRPFRTSGFTTKSDHLFKSSDHSSETLKSLSKTSDQLPNKLHNLLNISDRVFKTSGKRLGYSDRLSNRSDNVLKSFEYLLKNYDERVNISGRLYNISPHLFNTSNPQLIQQLSGGRKFQTHVFFLKVHKAASTTVMNLLYRFALRYGLNIMLPKVDNILSESRKNWRHAAIDLPQGLPYFDVLCNHLIFNEDLIRESLYPDSTFIGIVREPLSQFVSAFHFYKKVCPVSYLKSVTGRDPIKLYMQSPERWEPETFGQSLTHNRMSFDFGMDEKGLRGNNSHIQDYITYLDKVFDLVMVSERFDESIVLLRRLLGWTLQDVLYLNSNVFQQGAAAHGWPRRHSHTHFTEEEKLLHQSYNAADYALYDHFTRVFQKRVKAEGPSFDDELNTYRSVRRRVVQFCENTEEKDTTAPATDWNPSFQITRADCELMLAKENVIVDVKRRQQLMDVF